MFIPHLSAGVTNIIPSHSSCQPAQCTMQWSWSGWYKTLIIAENPDHFPTKSENLLDHYFRHVVQLFVFPLFCTFETPWLAANEILRCGNVDVVIWLQGGDAPGHVSIHCSGQGWEWHVPGPGELTHTLTMIDWFYSNYHQTSASQKHCNKFSTLPILTRYQRGEGCAAL